MVYRRLDVETKACVLCPKTWAIVTETSTMIMLMTSTTKPVHGKMVAVSPMESALLPSPILFSQRYVDGMDDDGKDRTMNTKEGEKHFVLTIAAHSCSSLTHYSLNFLSSYTKFFKMLKVKITKISFVGPITVKHSRSLMWNVLKKKFYQDTFFQPLTAALPSSIGHFNDNLTYTDTNKSRARWNFQMVTSSAIMSSMTPHHHPLHHPRPLSTQRRKRTWLVRTFIRFLWKDVFNFAFKWNV